MYNARVKPLFQHQRPALGAETTEELGAEITERSQTGQLTEETGGGDSITKQNSTSANITLPAPPA